MEILDIVNEKDEVVGQAPYHEVYTKTFIRRIVHVLIFNDGGEMALQLRSKKKRFIPGYWSTAVGGHVQSGESYDQAVMREMEEEVGISTKLDFLAKDRYHDVQQNNILRFLGTYKVKYNGPFKINLDEVEKLEFFSLDKIQKMIDDGEKFHPELLFLLNKHYKIKI